MMGQLTVCMQAKSWTATSLEIPAALGCPWKKMRERLSSGQNFGLGSIPGQLLCGKRDLFDYVNGPMEVHILFFFFF